MLQAFIAPAFLDAVPAAIAAEAVHPPRHAMLTLVLKHFAEVSEARNKRGNGNLPKLAILHNTLTLVQPSICQEFGSKAVVMIAVHRWRSHTPSAKKAHRLEGSRPDCVPRPPGGSKK